MANTLPNEKELYDKIKNEKITVPSLIWDLMYRHLGDDVSAITQITLFYWRNNKPIAVEAAKEILEHTKRINATVEKILHPEKIRNDPEGFKTLKNSNTVLHSVIGELFFHYIGNDVYGINMIINFHLNSRHANPVPLEDAQKILNRTFTMMEFLDRLKEATSQETKYPRKDSK